MTSGRRHVLRNFATVAHIRKLHSYVAALTVHGAEQLGLPKKHSRVFTGENVSPDPDTSSAANINGWANLSVVQIFVRGVTARVVPEFRYYLNNKH